MKYNSDNKNVLIVSGDPENHIPLASLVEGFDIFEKFKPHGSFRQGINTVYFNHEQQEIDKLEFSRARKQLPNLRKLEFDPSITKLPEVSADQVLKYLAKGVEIEASPELQKHLMEKILAYCQEIQFTVNEDQIRTDQYDAARQILAQHERCHDVMVLNAKDASNIRVAAEEAVGDQLYVCEQAINAYVAKVICFAPDVEGAKKQVEDVLPAFKERLLHSSKLPYSLNADLLNAGSFDIRSNRDGEEYKVCKKDVYTGIFSPGEKEISFLGNIHENTVYHLESERLKAETKEWQVTPAAYIDYRPRRAGEVSQSWASRVEESQGKASWGCIIS